MKAPMFALLALAGVLGSESRVTAPLVAATGRDLWWTSITQRPTRDSIVRALVIDGVRVRLDSTSTLASVQALLGTARVHEPTHHDDVAWTCYQFGTAADPTYLEFESDEIGGPTHRIMGFQLSKKPFARVPASACALARSVHSMFTDNGLSIGMPIADMLVIMHTPKAHASGRYEFEYSLEVRTPGERPYDIVATLRVETRLAHVTALSAWYAATT
jgi:hypothetical protein